MNNHITTIAVLGSTGSIGRSALEVIAASEGRLRAVALSAHRKTDLLLRQAASVRPRAIVVSDPEAAERQDWSGLPADCELFVGPKSIARLAANDGVDIVLSAIVGSAGLLGTWAALEAGKTVALANKESLVVGGPLVMELAKRKNARILPVDSEHCAVFQALQAGRREEVRRVVLTASGGPFRTFSPEQLTQVTAADALNHPTWAMGPKITIDSATLMNKALEIIEARWLFDLRPDQIAVMIHPQSIVHSMVEYRDGSVIAQLSPPDMKLPIQYALTWPERR
ncbi:MAG: 1-deoxy-D-xylulose-5-phosphate reductoisomerase, partial [Planctomycetaceae bacterium]|nr:1-deoxy-D-xylulose-5-phosphate reductoisomerase [Planctomycetaceae bacterium]